jgi:uncharacterized LabA/DUF88 family protein
VEKPSFNAYIDGFNLYKGALEKRPDLKWLDVRKLCADLRPDMSLQQIFYFTARVKERYPLDQAPRRQHSYLRTLTHQGVEIVYGKFIKDKSWLRLASLSRTEIMEPCLPSHFGLTQLAITKSSDIALPDVPKVQVTFMEEKGSDVGLASYLLRDAYQGKVQAALVVTGDSDLVTPIKFAVAHGMDVKTIVPNREINVDSLRSVSTYFEQLHVSKLASSQLPSNYVTPKGAIIKRPASWS